MNLLVVLGHLVAFGCEVLRPAKMTSKVVCELLELHTHFKFGTCLSLKSIFNLNLF